MTKDNQKKDSRFKLYFQMLLIAFSVSLTFLFMKINEISEIKKGIKNDEIKTIEKPYLQLIQNYDSLISINNNFIKGLKDYYISNDEEQNEAKQNLIQYKPYIKSVSDSTIIYISDSIFASGYSNKSIYGN